MRSYEPIEAEKEAEVEDIWMERESKRSGEDFVVVIENERASAKIKLLDL